MPALTFNMAAMPLSASLETIARFAEDTTCTLANQTNCLSVRLKLTGHASLRLNIEKTTLLWLMTWHWIITVRVLDLKKS